MKDAPLATPAQQAEFLRNGYAKPARLVAGGPEPIKVGQAPTSAAKTAPRQAESAHMTQFMQAAERVLKRWAGVADTAQPATPPAPKQPETMTLEQVRRCVNAHQRALRSAKTDTERGAAMVAARKFADQVVQFAGDVANLDVASDLCFALNGLMVATDHTELAEL